MTSTEKALFNCDITTVDWRNFCLNYAYGLNKFVLKAECDAPQSTKENIMMRPIDRWDYFMDVMWVYKRNQQI